MPIQIVQEEERLIYENEGSRIFYRRIPTVKRSFIQKKHTKRGQPDWSAVTKEFLEYVVLDWDGVEKGGKAIPYDKELVQYLPDDVTTEILDLSGASTALAREETGPKNSKTSSSGS
jgi:hypothetical protein